MVKCSHLKTKDASREGACPPWCLFALGGSRAFQDLSCYNREICQAKEEIIAMLKKKKNPILQYRKLPCVSGILQCCYRENCQSNKRGSCPHFQELPWHNRRELSCWQKRIAMLQQKSCHGTIEKVVMHAEELTCYSRTYCHATQRRCHTCFQ